MNAGRLHHLRKAVGMLTHGVGASRWAAQTKVIFTVLTEEHRVVSDVNPLNGSGREGCDT